MSEYTPSVDEMRADFVHEHTRRFDEYQAGRSLESEEEHYGDQFDRFLARVRRDAAREALDGYADAEEDSFLALHVKGAPISAAQCTHAAMTAREYRDTHYPEETP